jgi:phosphoribosylaminoimidazole-succinocarboxamide synthase
MLAELDRQIYISAYEHALERGVVILDTKFENSPDGLLLDEVLTPDSSRFTTPQDHEAAIREGRDPAFYDKQPARDRGAEILTPCGIGLQTLDPANREHQKFVADLIFPGDAVAECEERYLNVVKMLTGVSLDAYQSGPMEIPVLF